MLEKIGGVEKLDPLALVDMVMLPDGARLLLSRPPRLTAMRAAVVAAQADGTQPQVGPTEHQLAE